MLLLPTLSVALASLSLEVHTMPLKLPNIQLHSDHIKLLIIVTVIPQCVPHLLLFTVTTMASL